MLLKVLSTIDTCITMKKNIDYFLTEYLKQAPLFMSFIRPTEASLFHENRTFIKKPILDFGCGDGFFAHLVFDTEINVGIDLKINPRIRSAQNNKVYKKMVTYDGTIMPFTHNSFKTVVSNCVLEHVPNIEQSVSEIYRVLRKDGYFLTSVMTDNWSSMMLGSNLFGPSYARWLNKRQEHYSLYSPSKWKRLFLKQGFIVEKEIGYLFPHQAQLLDLFHYVSIPSLISYRLTKKWVLFPSTHLFLKSFIQNTIAVSNTSYRSAARFFILRKK